MKLKAKITKRSVDALKASSGKEERLWDTELNGFCVRAYPSGRKVYSITYRMRGRFRWYSIGKHGDPWTAEEARKEAKSLFGEIAKGIDPGATKAAAKSKAITVAKLIDMYLEEGPRDRPDKRASSWANDKSYLNNHARVLIGRREIETLKPKDLAKFQNDVAAGKSARKKPKGRGKAVTGGKGAAAHAIRSLSAALGWAVERELIQSNPCDKMRKLQDGVRERYLSSEEAKRLFKAIRDLQSDGVI
ncbi:MAG TPA: integrase arm-type DNA-binding domain-containing protein, partial [Parvularculaceae bacterium]|nr:integrase arm-type DNA-binding domain-containing protein [Parvularculaceae bacterium]